MITEKQVRSVALFFFLALLDERVALRAAHSVIPSLKSRLRSVENQDGSDARIAIMQACVEQFERHKKSVTRGKVALTFESGWSLPDHTELAPWARFHKDTSDEELCALIFSHVLGYETVEIATALGISEGTARYRIGRGVRHLGVANRLAL